MPHSGSTKSAIDTRNERVDPEVHAWAAMELFELLDQLIPGPHEFVPRIPLTDQLVEIKVVSRLKAEAATAVQLFACQGATFGATEYEEDRAKIEEIVRLAGEDAADALFMYRASDA
jgi:hypothetical protein